MPDLALPIRPFEGDVTTPMFCRHCGDACEAKPVKTADGTFCCGGCASVFAVVHDLGLGAFYACDIAPGVSQRTRRIDDEDRFAILDDPGTAAEFMVARTPRETRAVFRVPSLHCASCVWLVEQLWRVDSGVARTEVDLGRQTVRVDFDPSSTSLRKVAEALTSVGYAPSLDAADTTRQSETHRDLLLKIGVAGFAFGNVMLFSVPEYLSGQPLEPFFRQFFDGLNVLLSGLVLFYSASDFFIGAWRAARRGAITLDVPVALGLGVMFGRSVADIASRSGTGYFDSFTGLVFFLLVGKLFQQKAFDAIAFDRGVRSFLPLFVRVMRDGRLVTRPVQDLEPGDTFHLRPNEVAPADALLVDETATVDLAFITGEAAPVHLRSGDFIRAGARLVDWGGRLTAVRPASRSTLTELWAHPVLRQEKRRWLTDVANAFGAWFTLAACGLALIGAVAWWPNVDMSLQVATAVLIIACPCALTLAAPITLGTAMGVLGRAGCLLKTPAVALDLSRIDHVVFDKTGTLTAGSEQLSIDRVGLDQVAWRLVRALAGHSTHPVSRAIAASAITPESHCEVSWASEFPGEGVIGQVDGHQVVIGRSDFVTTRAGVPVPALDGWTFVAVDGRVGRLRLNAAPRSGVGPMLDRLKSRYLLSLLSGDQGHQRDIWRVWFAHLAFNQSAADKLASIDAAEKAGQHVLMVGDGLNDAGALAAAEVGMAVSDDTACLVPACDAIVRGDRLAMLPELLAYARRARAVIVFCFVVSIAYNVLGLTLALRGDLTPLVTAILMPLSSLTIIGLSVGLMRWRAPKALPV